MKSKGKRFWFWGMGLCIALPVLLAASSNMPSKAENVENTSTEVKVTATEIIKNAAGKAYEGSVRTLSADNFVPSGRTISA